MPVPVAPSPNDHENVSGSLSASAEPSAVRFTGASASALYGPPPLATGAWLVGEADPALTSAIVVALDVPPRPSLTSSVTVCCPACANVCAGAGPDAVAPSPKLHA